MKILIALILITTGAGLGAMLYSQAGHSHQATAADSSREVLYYRHPHNPSITSPEPRKDEMGMDYVPIYADGGGGDDAPGVIRVSPAVVHNMGVREASVERGALARSIETVGFVDYDEAALHHVHLRSEGWIEELAVRTTGERVEAGQLLFRLYSPMLVNAQEELLQTLRRGGAMDPARARLRALGMSAEEIAQVERSGQPRQLISVRARAGGVVQALNVAEGMFVQPGMEVMTIADLSRVWVLADLFEHQSDAVAKGNAARVKLPFRPGEALEGQVDYVYPTLSTPTRTVRARLAFDNQNGRLKPGMYADVSLTATPLEDVIHVPSEAVIRTGRQDRVILALGEGRFQARAVQVGRRAGERLEIIEGLEAGERIVASGLFLLDSEASVSGELSRLEDPVSDPVDPEQLWVEGVLNAVEPDRNRVNLDHEPIPEIGWPQMTMDFEVAPEVSLQGFEPGMPIRFRMREREEFVYEITAIEPLAGNDHDH